MLVYSPLQSHPSTSRSLSYAQYSKECVDVLSMVLKTGTMKEPENVLIIGFMVGPRSDRWSNR